MCRQVVAARVVWSAKTAHGANETATLGVQLVHRVRNGSIAAAH